MKVRKVPGYNGKYYVSRQGHVWRLEASDDGLHFAPLAQSQNRVYLIQNGTRERPRVWSVVKRAFGEDVFETFDDRYELDAVDGDPASFSRSASST